VYSRPRKSVKSKLNVVKYENRKKEVQAKSVKNWHQSVKWKLHRGEGFERYLMKI
jgi:hypothetical protein